MGKVIDITSRLGLEGRPSLKVAGNRYEVNDSAAAVTQVMALVGDGQDVTPDAAKDALCILLGDEAGAAIWQERSFSDAMVILEAATDLATGGDGAGGDEGNAETPATR